MADIEKRLIEEKEMLEKYFWPEKFPILLMNEDERGFEREVTLKSGNTYKLRVYVSDKYPDVLPALVVCESPEPMPEDEEWCGRHDTHTWPRKDGFLRICHWHEICWTRQNMLYQVFNKGEEWLEAYEKHVATGEPMALQQMMLTSEEEKKYREKLQHIALAAISMFHDPDWLADMFKPYCTVAGRQRNNADSVVAVELRRNEVEMTMQITTRQSIVKIVVLFRV